jgi:hypothetical protein
MTVSNIPGSVQNMDKVTEFTEVKGTRKYQRGTRAEKRQIID